MKIIFMALVIILSMSCGDDPKVKCNSKFTAGGLKVCSEKSLSASEVEFAVETVEIQTAERYPEVIGLKETLANYKVNVYFIDDPLAMECEELEHGIYRCDESIGGVNVDGDLIYIRYHPCLAFTSLGHEALHSIEKYYLSGKMIEDHKTPWLFEQAAELGHYPDTVEYQVFVEIFNNVASCAEYRN